MFDLRTVSPANRDTIVAMAQFLDRGKSAPANQRAHLLTLTPQQLQAVFEILGASQRDASTNAPSSADESSSSGEPSAKRVAVKRKMPPLLQGEWDVLCASGQEQNDQLFMRAQARALRSLVLFFNGGGHKRVKAEIFSFLTTQELCEMSGCSREANKQLKYESPRIWKALWGSYQLPERYWKNVQDKPAFIKEKTLENFRFLQRQNRTFEIAVSRNHPLQRWTTKMTGVALKQLRESSYTDPVQLFVRHTRYWIQTIINKSAKEHENFSDCMKIVRENNLDRKRFAEIFFACGEKVDLDTCSYTRNNGEEFVRDPLVLEEWKALTLEGMGKSPVAGMDRIRSLMKAYKTDYHGYPHIPPETVWATFTELLKRGLKIPSAALSLYAEEMASRKAQVELFGKLIDAAVKDDRLIYHSNEFGYHLCYLLEHYFDPDDEDSRNLSHLTIQEVIQIVQKFAPHTQRDGIKGIDKTDDRQPHMNLVDAAKKRSRELMEALFTAGIRPLNSLPLEPPSTLVLAINEKIPLEFIQLLCEFGAKADNAEFSLVEQYDPNLQVQEALRQLLFNSMLDLVPLRMALNP